MDFRDEIEFFGDGGVILDCLISRAAFACQWLKAKDDLMLYYRRERDGSLWGMRRQQDIKAEDISNGVLMAPCSKGNKRVQYAWSLCVHFSKGKLGRGRISVYHPLAVFCF